VGATNWGAAVGLRAMASMSACGWRAGRADTEATWCASFSLRAFFLAANLDSKITAPVPVPVPATAPGALAGAGVTGAG